MKVLLQAISRRIFGGFQTEPVTREEPRTHVKRNGDLYQPIYTLVNYHLGHDKDGMPIKESRFKFSGYHVQPRFIPWASVKATFPTKQRSHA